jgi:tRNA (mo5U34)-methyltransferase
MEFKMSEIIKKALTEIEEINFERDLNSPSDEMRIDRLSEIINLSVMRTLEVGCLDGYHTVQLAKKGAVLTTSDIRPYNLKKALFRCLYEGIDRVCFKLLDVETIPQEIGINQFDLLFCSGLIYHLHMPQEFLYSIKDHFKFIFLEGHVANEEKYGPLKSIYFMDHELFYTDYSELGYLDPQSAKDDRPSKWFTEESLEKIFDLCSLSIKSVIYKDVVNEQGRRVAYLLEREAKKQ